MSLTSKENFSKNLVEVNWQEYLKKSRGKTPEEWIFRGQSCQCHKKPIRISLKSGLERSLISYGIPLSDAPKIEEFMIREFQRKYEGIDSQIVFNDTLYCLSLMQHYGCPTRLLDSTYSPYIAAFFAVENISLEKGAKRKALVFCFMGIGFISVWLVYVFIRWVIVAFIIGGFKHKANL